LGKLIRSEPALTQEPQKHGLAPLASCRFKRQRLGGGWVAYGLCSGLSARGNLFMYPMLPGRLLPEECQEFTLFLQPGLQPYLIAATTTLMGREETEPGEKRPGVVIAVIAIYQGTVRLLSWMRRKLKRQRAIELPAGLVRHPK
jgi:hypothetical protein